MSNFLSSQLFSVIIGACLTMLASLVINKSVVSDSLDEEIAKEKIKAYKDIYDVICQLNHTLSLYDNENLPKDCVWGDSIVNEKKLKRNFCFPDPFINFYSMQEFKLEFSELLNKRRIFFNQTLVNKLVFLDSYLSEICHITYNKNDRYLQVMGFILFNEIDKLRSDIEAEIQDFFNSNKRKKTTNIFRNAYEYEHYSFKHTELYMLFIKNKELMFGQFEQCEACQHVKKCPFDFYIEKKEPDDNE